MSIRSSDSGLAASPALLPPKEESLVLSAATTATTTNNGGTRSSSKRSHGCLHATILSAYDLPLREPPLRVTVTVCDYKAETGPPQQRHKDRNSFKFSNGNHLNELEITAPLPELYKASAVVEIVYESSLKQQLKATYQLDQLKINETTWLILHLTDGSVVPPESTADHNIDDDDDDDVVTPSLRLQISLSGPYRTEIDALVSLAQGWFALVDGAESKSHQALEMLPKVNIDPKFLMIPLVPVAAIAVVSAPIVAGVLTIGLPLFLPVMVVGAVLAIMAGGMIFTTYCSTTQGRTQIASLAGPLLDTLLSTSSGQCLVYQTGPRPSPVQLTRMVVPNTIWNKLVLSLLIDLIGSSSYLIPLAGEGFDIGWAPMQTVLIMAMYNDVAPNLKYLSMVEELLPLTDIVPSATLGWLTEYGLPLIQDLLFGRNRQGSTATGIGIAM